MSNTINCEKRIESYKDGDDVEDIKSDAINIINTKNKIINVLLDVIKNNNHSDNDSSNSNNNAHHQDVEIGGMNINDFEG